MSKIQSIDIFDEKYTYDTSVESIAFTDESQLGMFETYGEDLEYVLSLANNPKQKKRVWTAIDGDDGGLYLVPGYRLVNRVYYVITKEKWKKDTEEYVIIDGDELNECERCGCQMDEDLNPTPFGNYYCEDCITMEDVFPEEDEE